MNFALLGTGAIARFHAQAVAALEGSSLVAVCDLDRGRAEGFAASYGLSGDSVYADVDAMLSRGDIDILLVTTPSGLHHLGVEAAARHGVNVLVEKPLEISTARIDEMAALCARASVQLGCTFQTRWTEGFTEARRKIESGELGRITYAAVQVPWWRSDEYYAAGGWRGTYAMDGGGAMMNQSIHMIDWLTALMPPVEEVKGFAATLAHPIETEDTAVAVLRFEGGALGSVYATTASFPGGAKRLEIRGTKGTYVYEDGVTGVSRPDQLDFEPHRRCFEAFVASLEGGEPYPVDAAAARRSVDLIERISGRRNA